MQSSLCNITMNFKLINYTVITVLTVNLLSMSGDVSITWSSPMFIKLESNDTSVNPLGRPITQTEKSYVGSLVNIGAMLGPFPYSYISERFGRKIGLLCVAIPHFIAYVTLAFSHHIYLFFFARIIGGIAEGGSYALLPMYVAEVSEDSMRGMLSSTLNIFWTFGNLISYIVGPYVSAMWFNIILACLPATFFVMFFLIGPETPYYLVKQERIGKAEESLMKLRSKTREQVQDELEHIQQVMAHNEESKFMDLFKEKVYLKALAISLFLIVAQQLSGINAVLMNTQDIFASVGSTNLSDDVSSIIVGLALFSSSFTTPFVVDRWGRRILLLISLIGNIITLVILGAFFYMQNMDIDSVKDVTFIPILSLVLFILTVNIGMGPIPWTISSELFPVNVKPAAASIVSATSWLTAFLVTNFFENIQDGIGTGETYWLFAGCCAVAVVVTFFFIPETKGKSFKEIQKMLDSNNKECDNDENIKT